MSNVVFTWELGGGLGHATSLFAVAHGLAADGHHCSFVLKNVIETEPLWRSSGFPVYQAPRWIPRPGRRGKRFLARDFTAILARNGYADREGLAALLGAWKNTFALLKPDLVVCDHAPTAALAARDDHPTIHIGTGFTVPPCDSDAFPLLAPEADRLYSHDRVLDNVNTVLKTCGCRALPSLPAIYRSEASFVLTYPQFDPYACHRTHPADGPLEVPEMCPEQADADKVFVYLPAEHGQLDSLIEALGRLSTGGWIYVRNAREDRTRELVKTGLEICRQPQDLEEIFPHVKAVLHHGGLGMTTQALLAGRPQVVCPMVLEQRLNAEAVQKTGSSIRLGGLVPPEKADVAVVQIVEEPRYREAAEAWAKKLLAEYSHGSKETVLACCRRVLAGKRPQ